MRRTAHMKSWSAYTADADDPVVVEAEDLDSAKIELAKRNVRNVRMIVCNGETPA